MRFKKSVKGYFKLGFIFMLYSSVMGFLLLFILLPTLLGGAILGGLTGVIISIPIAIAIIVFANGMFVYWFYTKNKFVR